MRCNDCGWKYPESLLSSMFTVGGNTPLICGICALKRMCAIHGYELQKFGGQIAESLRQAAIKWRKDHPTDAPIEQPN